MTTTPPDNAIASPRTPALSIAPMMAYSDRHFRFVMRQMTRRTLMYTEMVTANAIIYGDRDHLLGFSDAEHPLALQLGGDDPTALAQCAKIAEGRGYDEVNLNVGCPSDRVQNGCFGASLMARPERVAECVAAMMDAVRIPVTVKHRIGIDDIDRYEDMERFVGIVADAGCWRFTVHARKAWLQGLSPKENRDIPPLRYDDVHRLKDAFPHLDIEINGGIKTLDHVAAHLPHLDAAMLGRAAIESPWVFARADTTVFGEESDPHTSRFNFVESLFPYIDEMAARGEKLLRTSRHVLNLFAGQPGSRVWKRTLSQNPSAIGEDAIEVMRQALEAVRRTQVQQLEVDASTRRMAAP